MDGDAVTSIKTGPRFAFVACLNALASSIRWAIEMRRRCERHMSSGQPLDGDAVKRIAAEVDAWERRQ